MQFLVIGLDGKDSEALNRRLAARGAHVETLNKLRAAGKMLFGGAIMDESEKMIGSALICDFESRAELDDWLKNEPFVTGKVWDKVEIQKFSVGPAFQALLAAKTTAAS